VAVAMAMAVASVGVGDPTHERVKEVPVDVVSARERWQLAALLVGQA